MGSRARACRGSPRANDGGGLSMVAGQADRTGRAAQAQVPRPTHQLDRPRSRPRSFAFGVWMSCRHGASCATDLTSARGGPFGTACACTRCTSARTTCSACSTRPSRRSSCRGCTTTHHQQRSARSMMTPSVNSTRSSTIGPRRQDGTVARRRARATRWTKAHRRTMASTRICR